MSPSFLFRRKAAEENHLRGSCSSCFCRFRGCAAQNGRLTYEPSVFRSTNEAGYAGNALPPYAPRLAMSFVSALQEKRSPSLSEEKQQKNIIFGTAALRASAGFAGARHKTGGSHTSRPFFVVQMKPGYAGNALPTHAPRLAMSLFLSFKKRNRIPLALRPQTPARPLKDRPGAVPPPAS